VPGRQLKIRRHLVFEFGPFYYPRSKTQNPGALAPGPTLGVLPMHPLFSEFWAWGIALCCGKPHPWGRLT